MDAGMDGWQPHYIMTIATIVTSAHEYNRKGNVKQQTALKKGFMVHVIFPKSHVCSQFQDFLLFSANNGSISYRLALPHRHHIG